MSYSIQIKNFITYFYQKATQLPKIFMTYCYQIKYFDINMIP